MDNQTQLEILIAALETIIGNAPDIEPEEETYDDMESAYSNGWDCAAWTAARHASKALSDIKGDSNG